MPSDTPNILLTGADGQLGHCIQDVFAQSPGYNLINTDVNELDITNEESVFQYFNNNNLKYCINSAAYTAVDQAEDEAKLAFLINAEACTILAKACAKFNVKLIHVSTDYVYDSIQNASMDETAPTSPRSIYGQSKLLGEQNIIKQLASHYILRTSWLYSEYGNNFVKTMLKLGKSGADLKVINDQYGAPTYAMDLARLTQTIIQSEMSGNQNHYGIYNFSNSGSTNWFEFASEALQIAEIETSIKPVPSSEYITKAPRPGNSRFDLNKVKTTFNTEIPDWRDSLAVCIMNMQKLDML